MQLTGNETNLLGAFGSAIISAVVSFAVARWILKRSPDYQTQLNELRNEIQRMSAVHKEALEYQKQISRKEDERREAEAWRPEVITLRNDEATRSNYLSIRCSEHFRIIDVQVMTESGVVIETIEGENQSTYKKNGELLIPQSKLISLLNNDPDYQRNGKTIAKLRCTLDVGIPPKDFSFILPIRAVQEVTDHTVWAKLRG